MDNGIDDEGDGATDEDNNNGDGATDSNIDKDGYSDSAMDDDGNGDGAMDNDDIDGINDSNLPPHVGKRNDGCNETKI